MLVESAMSTRVTTVDPDATLQVAATLMREASVGALLVERGGELLGFVTDRDLVVRGVAEGRDPARARVRDAMTPQVVTCHGEDDLETAADLMAEHAVRRLVVLDADGQLAGLLSVDDLAARSHALAGEVVEAALAPGARAHHGSWPWWE